MFSVALRVAIRDRYYLTLHLPDFTVAFLVVLTTLSLQELATDSQAHLLPKHTNLFAVAILVFSIVDWYVSVFK